MNVRARITALRLIEKKENMSACFERLGIDIKLVKKDNNMEEKENEQLCSG